MLAKPVVLGLLAAGCVTAAAGGAYVAVRHNQATRVATPSTLAAPDAPRPVAETEAIIVAPTPALEKETPPADSSARSSGSGDRTRPRAAVKPRRAAPPSAVERSVSNGGSSARPAAAPNVERPRDVNRDAPIAVERPAASRESSSDAASTVRPVQDIPEPAIPEPPPAPARRQIVEVVLPASSVVGLKVETSLSSETARVEDRVEARVTRDVLADGRLAIPAGTRVLGDVVTAERGGKMKEKARLGVRFHTVVLADGHQVPFRTDAIYREGSSPGAESARKIGGAAVGGAILGAIIGGAKGAAIGGATGAAGGSAVVMAGDRNPATLPAGTIVTVRLTSPVSVDVEKES
jgi:hypothetical protein